MSEFGGTMHGARVGERLRIARESQELALPDIAARTRIPMRHLQMIESGDYDGLPAATYSAGFVKTYANLLGLDGQQLSQDFRSEMGAMSRVDHQPAPYEPADPNRTPPLGLALLALFLAVVAGLGYLYWRGSQPSATEVAAAASDTAPAPTAASPATPVSAPAVPAAPAGGAVVIAASEDVWIKVADSGKNLFMGLLKAGDRYTVPADAVAPLLTTGRPGNTQITVGQTPIPTVGDPDRAAKNVSLKTDALLARVATPAPAVQPAAGAPTPVEGSAGPG